MSKSKKQLTDAKKNTKKNIFKRSSGKLDAKPASDTPSFGSQLMILFLTMGIAAVMIIALGFHPDLTFTLPLLVVLALIMFVVSLTLAAVVLTRMGLACKYEALGLPSGSVGRLLR